MKKRKPKIFEDLSDDLFDLLPLNYALLEEGSSMDIEISSCDFYGAATYICEPFYRPISKILTRGDNADE